MMIRDTRLKTSLLRGLTITLLGLTLLSPAAYSADNVAAALAHIDVDAGLGFEGFGEFIADLLVLAVVQGQRNASGRKMRTTQNIAHAYSAINSSCPRISRHKLSKPSALISTSA